GLDDGAVVVGLDDARAEVERHGHRRRTLEEHVEVRGHGAGRRAAGALAHEVHGRGPVAVAVEQRAADAAVEDVVERGVVRLGRPGADELVALLEAADAQPFVVGRPAAEAAVPRRVGLLNAFHRAPAYRLARGALSGGRDGNRVR